MKRVAFGLIVLLLTATVFTAGCTVNTSNPTATPTPKPDYSATFASMFKSSSGWTPINRISQLSENVYSGSYNSKSANGSTHTYEIKIEVAKSEADAKARYGELVLQKQDAGYTSQDVDLRGSTIYGDTKASWMGYKVNSLISASEFTVLYAYNTGISEWLVVTMSGDTFSTK
jgi:hypothetical protein